MDQDYDYDLMNQLEPETSDQRLSSIMNISIDSRLNHVSIFMNTWVAFKGFPISQGAMKFGECVNFITGLKCHLYCLFGLYTGRSRCF